jgi:hypothetical protein
MRRVPISFSAALATPRGARPRENLGSFRRWEPHSSPPVTLVQLVARHVSRHGAHFNATLSMHDTLPQACRLPRLSWISHQAVAPNPTEPAVSALWVPGW